MRMTNYVSVAVVVTVAFIGSVTMPAAAGQYCGAQIKSGEASGKTESEGKAAAEAWWSSRAGARGNGYEVWDNAKEKSVHCRAGPRDTFECIAAAKPCLREGVLPDNLPKHDL